MTINLNRTIYQQRKARGLTQQQVADFLGVSKATVSKWETGVSLPDITQLPMLAAYFGLSIDQLMDYQAVLNPEQIKSTYVTFQQALVHEPAAQVLDEIRLTIHRYYSCPPLLIAMGQLLINHFDLLPGSDQAGKAKQYLPEADALFVHARELSDDPILIDKAAKLSAYCALNLQQPERVFKLLGKASPESLPADSLIAMAHQLNHDHDQAVVVTQSALYQQVVNMLSQLTNYLALLSDNPTQFHETVVRGQALIEAFKLPTLNPLATLNFLAAGFMGFVQQKAVPLAVGLVQQYLTILAALQVPVQLHGDRYFDQIEPWLADSLIGQTLPRDPTRVRHDLWQLVAENPLLDSVRNTEAFRPVTERLAKMKEKFDD